MSFSSLIFLLLLLIFVLFVKGALLPLGLPPLLRLRVLQQLMVDLVARESVDKVADGGVVLAELEVDSIEKIWFEFWLEKPLETPF